MMDDTDKKQEILDGITFIQVRLDIVHANYRKVESRLKTGLRQSIENAIKAGISEEEISQAIAKSGPEIDQ